MFSSRSPDWKRRACVDALLASIVLLVVFQNTVKADDVPAFFLKIAKNIPRVGRSDKFEDTFAKFAKNMPKIGRHEDNAEHSWPSYDDSEHFPGPSKRRLDYPSINPSDSWTWQHFPLAIEGPRELWQALAGYSRDPLEDMGNEIWQRKKRTEEESIDSKEDH